MSKLLLFIAALLIFTGLPIFAAEGEELELGMAFVPIGAITKDDGEQLKDEYGDQMPDDPYYNEEKTFMEEWLVGFHVAYNWGIVYASLDAIALPPFMIKDMTMYDNPEDGFFGGFDRPGFLNFIDVGAKFTLGDIVLFGSAGVNHLYIYREGDIPDEMRPGSFGTNLRIGASYMIMSNLSVGLTGTSIFPTFGTMADTLKGVFGDPEYAHMKGNLKLVPMLAVTYYM